MASRRTIFYISDRTGITAEMLGQSLLSHFPGETFTSVVLRFIDNNERVRDAVALVNQAAARDGVRPIIFSTLVEDGMRDILREANALVMDCFETFVHPLEHELRTPATTQIGRSHGADNVHAYDRRIEAVNYTLSHDDGVTSRDLEHADIVLLGVSRSGKTPTCLYLAMQFGVKAANYPIIPEDMERMKLPGQLSQHRSKLYGLTISPERLQQIRAERRPNSTYSSMQNCRYEVQAAERLLRAEGIPFFESTSKSVEELSATILKEARLQKQVF